MTEQVNVEESGTQLSKLVERVESGEEIVLARRDRVVARIVPDQRSQPRTPRRLGGCEDLIDIPEDFDEPDPEIEALFYGEASDDRRAE